MGRGDEAAVRERHVNFFVATAEDAEPHPSGPDQIVGLKRLMTLFDDSLVLQRAIGNKPNIANMLTNLGHVARRQGDFKVATVFCKQGLVLNQEIGDKPGIADALSGLPWSYATNDARMPLSAGCNAVAGGTLCLALRD